MTRSMVVSIDELRAASRLVGASMPPLLAGGDPDDTRVDLAALRGLAARGHVVGLETGDPEPVGDLADTLAALDDMVALAEVERDLGCRNGQHRRALGGGPGPGRNGRAPPARRWPAGRDHGPGGSGFGHRRRLRPG